MFGTLCYEDFCRRCGSRREDTSCKGVLVSMLDRTGTSIKGGGVINH